MSQSCSRTFSLSDQCSSLTEKSTAEANTVCFRDAAREKWNATEGTSTQEAQNMKINSNKKIPPKFHFASSEVKPLWNYSLSAKKWELVSSSWTCTHSQLLPVMYKYLNKQRVSSCNYSFSILYTWGLNQVTNPQFLIVQTDWRLWHNQWSPLYLIRAERLWTSLFPGALV